MSELLQVKDLKLGVLVQKRPSILAVIIFCLVLGATVLTCGWFRQPFLFPQWMVIYLFTLFSIIYVFKDSIVIPQWGKWINYTLLGLALSLVINIFIQPVPVFSQANLDRLTFIILFLTFLKLFHCYSAEVLWKYFCWSIIVASIVFFSIAYYEYFSGLKLYNAGSLFAASLGNINMAAEFIGISFFCQVFLCKQSKNKKLIYLLMALLVVTVVYLYFARCRSVLIGVMLGSGFLIAIRAFLDWHKCLIIAVASAALIILLLHFSPTRGLGLYTPEAGLKASGFGIRWQMITDALNLFWHHPFGVGPNNYEFSIVPYQSEILYQSWQHTHIHPHSEPVRFLVEDGIVACTLGSLFLLGMLCKAWRRLSEIYREPLFTLILSLSFYFLAEFLFEFPLSIGISFIAMIMIFAYACYRLFPVSIASVSGNLLKSIPGYFIFSVFIGLSGSMIYANSHYRTVAARKALFLACLMSFLCSQKSHKKDDMKHIRELQLLLSEYFNLSGHNLECLSFFVIGMFMVQTVNLAKLSKTFSTATKSESNYKRLQRFIRRLKFSDDALFLMIRKVFNLTGPLTLCLDRTNWKFGKTHINYRW